MQAQWTYTLVSFNLFINTLNTIILLIFKILFFIEQVLQKFHLALSTKAVANVPANNVLQLG